MPQFDLERFRTEQMDRLKSGTLDLLVLGGGILGAGVARDATLRGLRVGLVEQHDVAFGTSSRTSRLLHGGLRYLAQGRVGLVRQASQEKRILYRIAPHLAQPLAFVFPTYRRSGWPLWKLRVGVQLYDWLCGGGNLGPSSAMRADEVLNRLPGPRREGLTGAVRYYDALTNDARLVIDTLRSAADHGAIALNYARAEAAEPIHDAWRCQIRDRLGDRCFEVLARVVVHATGPWASALPQSSLRLRLTKGVHVVIQRDRLPVPDAVVITEGQRILFAIPWGDRVILGTTDTDYTGPLDDVRTSPEDVDYILEAVNRAFPAAGIDRQDVVSVWAGVRPLIAQRGGGPSDISRAHQIRQPHRGWIDVGGGKLTTYRRIAQEVVDRVFVRLGRPCPPCRTAELPLVEPDHTRPEASGVLPPEPSESLVMYYCHKEWAVHLQDVMVRRTSWRRYYRDHRELAERVAVWMAGALRWDAAKLRAELNHYDSEHS